MWLDGRTNDDIRDVQGIPSAEWYNDEELVVCYEYISRRDPDLKREILAYFEKNDPRAKAAAEQQMTLDMDGL